MPQPIPPGPADPRPLAGEPLAIDLLNTRWNTPNGPQDLLGTVGGLAVWLDSPTVRQALADGAPPAGEDVLECLRQAREAIAAAVEAPQDPAAHARLNEVLAHGRIRRLLTAQGPAGTVETDSPAWLPAWTAAESYLHLLGDRPERIRPCANPGCVLHFYDVSKNGTRRWCSMSGCGNRAKASRHYARHGGGS
ncbi:CGNR zinc finger domain-containing protein [Kitasatospora sp. NPDC096147]|uniref:CGNR zinc finger domain-containing protein n=1 Tax=Kitasatospora sp. NPDC096147 TaxID=3364093 RepID=UPI003808F147